MKTNENQCISLLFAYIWPCWHRTNIGKTKETIDICYCTAWSVAIWHYLVLISSGQGLLVLARDLLGFG